MNARDKLVAEAIGFYAESNDEFWWKRGEGMPRHKEASLHFCSSPTPETEWMCLEWLQGLAEPRLDTLYDILQKLNDKKHFLRVDFPNVQSAASFLFRWRLGDLADAIADVLEEKQILMNVATDSIRCLDCGVAYSTLGLDLVLPDQQWRAICPENRILCGNCICKRAAKFGGTVILAWVDSIDYSLADLEDK